MFNKKVNLNIYSSNIPYELTILSCDGRIIKNVIIQSTISKLCVCTGGCSIRLLASFNNQTIYQKILLGDCQSQSVFASFGFESNINPEILNIITLTDATYGLPVANAILNFK